MICNCFHQNMPLYFMVYWFDHKSSILLKIHYCMVYCILFIVYCILYDLSSITVWFTGLITSPPFC